MTVADLGEFLADGGRNVFALGGQLDGLADELLRCVWRPRLSGAQGFVPLRPRRRSPSGIASSGGFDRCVEGEQVGLERDPIDVADDGSRPLGGISDLPIAPNICSTATIPVSAAFSPARRILCPSVLEAFWFVIEDISSSDADVCSERGPLVPGCTGRNRLRRGRNFVGCGRPKW